MTKPARVLTIILLSILIPILVYAYLQIQSLGEDEKRAGFVYEKQMETVLFSLNQYADDMTSRWVRSLFTLSGSIIENSNTLTLENESIQLLVIKALPDGEMSSVTNDYIVSADLDAEMISSWYGDNDSLISRLTTYMDAGYQRIHPVNNWIPLKALRPDQMALTVMMYDRDSVLHNALMVLEMTYWIEQILGPKMQQLDHDDFSSMVFQQIPGQEDPDLIFSTNDFDQSKAYVNNELWLFPEIFLAIQPKGVGYIDLIKARSEKNLYFLFFAIIVVLIGGFVAIRNVSNTMKIAQLKSDFVSNVSHEIRTPLSLIRMYSETLMLGRLPNEERKKQYYQIIHRESGRLTYLVNNILDFSRIEANRKTYEMTDQEFNGLVESLYNNYEHYFMENEVKAELLLAQTPIQTSVDVQAFEEALSNLIENAVKYSNGEKMIEISTYEKQGFACCDVRDHGMGISKSAQKHIFEKFYRVESAMTQKTKGTGLGLSLVRHIMDAHNGDVVVNSKPGKGSTFTLKFPIKQN